MISLNEIMTPDPVTLAPDVPLKNAGELMRERRIRHIPVTRDGRLEGLITQRDLLAAASAEDDYSTVADVMRTHVYTVSEDDDMRGAALKMQKHNLLMGAVTFLQDSKTNSAKRHKVTGISSEGSPASVGRKFNGIVVTNLCDCYASGSTDAIELVKPGF